MVWARIVRLAAKAIVSNAAKEIAAVAKNAKLKSAADVVRRPPNRFFGSGAFLFSAFLC